MSKINELIKNECENDSAFKEEYQKENTRLGIAVALMKLREEKNMSQREFALVVGKPQSTIARIENGSMSPSIKTLEEIAKPMGRKIEVSFAEVQSKISLK